MSLTDVLSDPGVYSPEDFLGQMTDWIDFSLLSDGSQFADVKGIMHQSNGPCRYFGKLLALNLRAEGATMPRLVPHLGCWGGTWKKAALARPSQVHAI